MAWIVLTIASGIALAVLGMPLLANRANISATARRLIRIMLAVLAAAFLLGLYGWIIGW